MSTDCDKNDPVKESKAAIYNYCILSYFPSSFESAEIDRRKLQHMLEINYCI